MGNDGPSDPAEADLFIMPLVPTFPKYGFAESDAAEGEEGRVWEWIKPMCRMLWESDLSEQYAYLSEETAARHMVVAVNFTPILGFCTMSRHMEGLDAEPVSKNLMKSMRWISHE